MKKQLDKIAAAGGEAGEKQDPAVSEKTDRIKIQIQFLVLTLLFQSLSFCRTPELRKNCFLH